MQYQYIFIFMLGTIIGSFLNVCIYRIPRGESIVFPSSHCTNCGQNLKANHLVPVLSYIFLGGKCGYCKDKISPQYPLIELLTGFLFTMAFYKYSLSFYFFKYLLLIPLLIIISLIDLQIQIIPNRLIVFGLLAGLVFTFIDKYYPASGYFLGALIGGGILLFIAVISRGGMGGGDVKLLLVLGLFLGWEKVLITLFLAFVIGGFFALAILILGKKGRKDAVPFGPFINIGALAAIFFEVEIINLYFSLL